MTIQQFAGSLPATGGDVRHPLNDLQSILRATAWALVVALSSVCLVLMSRRSAHALHVPLDVAFAAVAGICLALIGWTIRWGLQFPANRGGGRIRSWFIWGLPAILLALTAGLLTLPGTTIAAAAVLWGCLLIGEGIAAWEFLKLQKKCFPPHSPPIPAKGHAATVRVASVAQDALESRVSADDDEESLSELVPPGVMQQLTRRTDDELGDVLEGYLRAPLPAGTRATVLHLAFCPPFERVPQVVTHVMSGPELTVAAAQKMSYGVRLEVRLARTIPLEDEAILFVQCSSPKGGDGDRLPERDESSIRNE